MKEGKEENLHLSIDKNLLAEKSSFEEFEENLKKAIFGVLFVLLRSEEFSFFVEVLFLLLELLQFMSFPFNDRFKNIWKTNEYKYIQSFLSYFQIYIFFQDSSQTYLIIFYIFICLVILVIINIIYVSYSFSRNHFGAVWPLRLLRSCVSFIVTVLFMPIFELFVSMIECENVDGVYMNHFGHMECWKNSFYIHALLGIMVSVTFVIICLVVSLTYFESKPEPHNHSARVNSRSDFFMLVAKIINILMFAFLSRDISFQWVIVIATFVLSAFMYLNFYFDQPYYNDHNMKLHLVCTGIYLWSNVVLLVGKIVESTQFDGCLELFFTGLPIIITTIFFMKDSKLEILLTHINKFQKGEQCQMQIRYFLELIEQQHDRHSRITLRGYIYLFEEFCTSTDCPLKKYIRMCDQGEDNFMYLYQHAQVLYQNALAKFSNCAPLRISYSFFLLERLHNKQLASIELNIAEKYNPKFDEQFIIFRYKKLIEETSDFSEGVGGNLDVVSNIAYQNHFNQFKQGIQRAATLYIDFWSLLISPNKNNQEDLTKLNEYGSKINTIVEDITLNFEKMQKLKHNDQEALRLYTEFLSEILNEKEKSSTLKNRLNEIEGTKLKTDDMDNIDMNNFHTNDENQYIILSSDKEKFGLINKITLGICVIFGYSKAELLGKHIDILIPEPYQNSHNEILSNKLKDYIKMITYSKKGKSNKINPKEVFAFGKNKSRYLVPLNFKFSLLPVHDQNTALFIAKVIYEQVANNLEASKVCYLISSHKLVITHITTNAINMLGITQNLITSSTVEISKVFPELNDENLREDLYDENITNDEYQQKVKKYLLERFQNPRSIPFKKNDENNNFLNRNQKKENNSGSLIKDKDTNGKDVYNLDNDTFENSISSKKKMEYNLEDRVNLSITDLTLNGKSEGYIFKLETIKPEITKEMNKHHNEKESIHDSSIALEKIDMNYIPKDNVLFDLDPKKGAFRKNTNTSKIKNYIQNEANNKLMSLFQRDERRRKRLERLEKKKNKNSDSSSSSNSSDDEKSSNISPSRRLANVNSEYYQVNMENIKFQFYHHKSHTIKDATDNEYKISQYDLKKLEEVELREMIYKIKTNNLKPQKANVVEMSSNDTLQIKLIENALTKEEAQPTIVRLKWVAFSLFLIIITLTIVFLSDFLATQSNLKTNVNFIKYNYRIITNFVISAYHVRELILLSNPNYTNYLGSRTEWIDSNIHYIMVRFNETHDLEDYIQSTSLPLSSEHSNMINSININIQTLLANMTIFNSKLSISSAIIEANTALFHISNDPSVNYSFNNLDCFFFLQNVLNSILKVLYQQSEIYKEELIDKISATRTNFLILVIVISVFCVISFFLLSHFYEKVGIRKESYLGIFFQIDTQIIKGSLEKSEKFNKKIQSDNNVSENNSNPDEDQLLDDDKTESEKDNKEKKEKKGPSKKVSSSSQNNSEQKKYSSWESKMVNLKIFIGQFLKIVAFSLLYYFYNSFLIKFDYYNQILNELCKEESVALNYLNIERELFAGDLKTFFGNNTRDYLIDKLNNAYHEKEFYDNVTLTYKNYLPSDYLEEYDNITNKNICYICQKNFTQYNISCEHFMHNSTSYGMNEVLSAYFQELRESFVEFNHLTSTYNTNKTAIFSIFNTDHLRNLGIQTIFIVRNGYEKLILSLYKSITDSITNLDIIYLASFIGIITGILIKYLFFWKPFEEDLNQTIHKTKNMLLIIPKEILAGLSNINKLLDIGTSEKKKPAPPPVEVPT